MSEECIKPAVEVLKPLQFPLNCATVCDILGVAKSTLLRWVDDKLILLVERVDKGGQPERCFSADDLTRLFLLMKGKKNNGPKCSKSPSYPWLKDFDPTKEYVITTPSGYRIKYG